MSAIHIALYILSGLDTIFLFFSIGNSMYLVLFQMILLVACGTFWRSYAPKDIPVSSHRRALTDLVFYILLPAMVLDVIWLAPMDKYSLLISLTAVIALLIAASLMWIILKLLNATNKQMGALILAGTFPNSTYMGLPVLDQILGSWSNSVVLQYDLFACTPILLSLGILMAQYFGNNNIEAHPLRELLKVPPLWAVTLAVMLNMFNMEQPEVVHHFLSILGGGVVPLMLIVLGMSIRWGGLRLRFIPLLLPTVIMTLLIIPLAVLHFSYIIDLKENYLIAVVLVASMPTMVFGVFICEKYQLDSELYAAAVTLSSICSLVTLPIWHQFLVN